MAIRNDEWLRSFFEDLADRKWAGRKAIKESVASFGANWETAEGRQRILADLFLQTFQDHEAAHLVFLDAENTALEKQLRNFRLQQVNSLSRQMNDSAVRRLYEGFLEDTPGDARVMNGFAWILATCPRKEVRDPARALDLVQKALSWAEKEGTNAQKANFMTTLAAVLYDSGDAAQALEAQTRAIGLLDRPAPGLRKRMDERLAIYEKAIDRDD
jgi:tetratricopeptide (TPR) repeat protein